ncbi:hypothetical protein L7F22_008504 [Adiantum nelumboides]|nr:hypothetical protein [Adiantum nelumboides]
METDKDTNLDKIDVSSHYKKYTIQDRKIIVQQPMRELKEPRTSYDGPEKAKTIDLAELGEVPKPAYIATDLTEEEEKLLIATLKRYKDVFAWSYKDLKGVDPSICQHTIPLKSDVKPGRQRPYTYNETFAKKIKEEINKLKEAEFIHEIEHTEMPCQKQAKQWAKGPYEVDELSTHEKSDLSDKVLAQIPTHICIANFKDAEGESIKATIMPREIWTLHQRPEVVNAVRAIHSEQYFRLPPWGTNYMQAHELMSSIQYDGQALLTDKDGTKSKVLIAREIINEALHFYQGQYDLLVKIKSIDNGKAFLKAKDNKYKYSDMIYVVKALAVAENRTIRCNYGKFILENLVEANLKGSAKNKLHMSADPMLTKIAYQTLDMIKDLPVAGSQASLIQHARFVVKPVKTTTTATFSRATRSSKKSSSDDEKTDTDKEEDSQDKKSKKPRLEQQVLLAEAQARVEERKKMLAKARAVKVAAKVSKPKTMEEARLALIKKAKALQEERRRIEIEQKAQEGDSLNRERLFYRNKLLQIEKICKHVQPLRSSIPKLETIWSILSIDSDMPNV